MIKKHTILPAFLILIFLLPAAVGQAQCCSYTLNMQDSYGDGWNGGYLAVYVNNTFLGNFSGANYGSSATFEVCTGDTLTLFYTAGDYENENAYQLFDGAYNLLLANGPTPPTGNVLTILGNCAAVAVPGSHPCTALAIDTGQCLVVDNTGYAGSGLKPNCSVYTGGDVWLTLQVPPSGNLGFETSGGTLNDTGVAIWADSSCAQATLLACDDDSGDGYYSLLSLYDLPPGQWLYIQTWGYGGATGAFELCVKDLGTITFDSSELPIVVIHTLGQTIVQNTKINAQMEIKYNGPNAITYLIDSANVYSGPIGVEIRGATSAGFPQPSYGLETRDLAGANNNVSLLGMPEENDWVLLSNYNDRSLVRNTLAFKLFAEMGNYSPRTSLCEVVIDSSYKGIYVFGEKIKRDNDRVDIARLTAQDSVGDDLTGGYILQQNYWEPSNSFQSNYSPIDHPGFDVHFVYEYPDAATITAPQKAYIAAYVDSLETALYSADFSDPLVGYRKYLDVKSFIDYFIVNELSRNNDGFKKSVFFYKDKYSNGGKLKAGPVWDFDWAWKNMATCDIFSAADGSGWAHRINDCPTDNYSCGWYVRLLQDSTFNDELQCTYENYRHSILDTTYLFAYLDSVENLVQQAQARHFRRWNLLGVSGFAPEIAPSAETYHAELDTLKAWITIRLQWLDANMPGLCLSTGSEPAHNTNPLKYYPNPSTGLVHFEGSMKTPFTAMLNVYDVSGKLVEQVKLNPGEINFNLELTRPGVFYFEIRDNNALLQHGKLVVIGQD